MEHLDPELLSLLALGEHMGTDAEEDHLASCPTCSETLRSLQYAVHIATLDPTGIELEAPGSHNWTAIHQALGLSPGLAADPLTHQAGGGPSPAEKQPPRAATPRSPSNHGKDSGRTPVPLRSGTKDRRASTGGWIAVAAGIVLGTAAGWAAAGALRDTGTPAPVSTQSVPAVAVLAQTALSPLPAHTGSGNAQVEQLPDGTRQLVVRLSNEHIAGFRGVWVGSADLTKMVSLGVLANDSGSFAIPAGIDLAQYPIVDISDQPYNGDPAHSADSIARGKLNPKN